MCSRLILVNKSLSRKSMLHFGEALETTARWSYESGGAKDNDPYLGRRADEDASPIVKVYFFHALL